MHQQLSLIKRSVPRWEEPSNKQVVINQEGPLVLLHSGAMDHLVVIQIIIFCWKEFGDQKVIIIR